MSDIIIFIRLYDYGEFFSFQYLINKSDLHESCSEQEFIFDPENDIQDRFQDIWKIHFFH